MWGFPVPSTELVGHCKFRVFLGGQGGGCGAFQFSVTQLWFGGTVTEVCADLGGSALCIVPLK